MEANGKSITQLSIPVVAVVSLIGLALAGGFGWWQSELNSLRAEIQSHSQGDEERLTAHAATDGHQFAITKLASLDRELSSLRERFATFDSTLLERDRERVRRLEAMERRAEKRDQDWEALGARLAVMEANITTLCDQHARFSVAKEP